MKRPFARYTFHFDYLHSGGAEVYVVSKEIDL